MAKDPTFGRLVKEGIASVARRQDKRKQEVEEDIAEKLGYSVHTVRRWQRGYIPAQIEHVEFLVRYCLENGRVDDKWALNILTRAQHPKPERVLGKKGSRFSAAPRSIHNLPARFGDFIGRRADLSAVLEALRSPWPVILIEGLAGVGKTTLALEVAYACAGHPREAARDFSWPRFDAIVWMTAAEKGLTVDDFLNTLALRLDYPGLANRPFREKWEGVRDVLARQSALIVLDEFEAVTDDDIAAFLVQVPAGTKVLLTGRERGQLLPPAFRRFPPAHVHLDGLAEEEALAFLRLQARRQAALRGGRREHERSRLEQVVRAARHTLQPLIRATEGNPLAMSLALSYIADQALSLATLVQHLYTAAESMEELFDRLFAQAWERCGEPARRLWCVIPLFVAPARREALKAAAGLEGRYFRDALTELQARSLLEAVEGADGEPRYRAHPLVRAYGTRRLETRSALADESRERWVGFYVDFVSAADLRDWDRPEPFRTIAEEWPNIWAAIEWLQQTGDLERLARIFEQVKWFMHIYGYWEQRLALARAALSLAEEKGDERQTCTFLTDLGWTLALQDRFREAEEHLKRARERAEKLGGPELRYGVYEALTLLYQRSGRFSALERVLPLMEEAAQAVPEPTRSRHGVVVLYRKATAAYDQGRWEEARALFEEMLQQTEAIRWERAVAYALNYLGEIALLENDLERARTLLEQGRHLIQRWQDKRRLAYYHRSFALLHFAQGDRARALEAAESALDLFGRLGMRREEMETRTLIEVLEEAGHEARITTIFQKFRTPFQASGEA